MGRFECRWGILFTPCLFVVDLACFYKPTGSDTAASTNSGSTSSASTSSATTEIGASASSGSAATTDDTGISGTTGTSMTEPPTSSTTSDITSSTTNITTMTESTTDMPCRELMVTLEPVKPNTMLVLDKSGSMLQKWDHDANANTPTVTRWYSLHAAVNQLLTDFQGEYNFGANLFPSATAKSEYNSNACLVNDNVEAPVAAINKDAILAALPAQDSMMILGATPTAKGMTAALDHLKSLDPVVPRVVILVTDGAANCSTDAVGVNDLFEVYDANLAGIVADAYTIDQIPTYVIGIAISNQDTSDMQDGNPDGINPYEKLNELAVLGGTAKPGPEDFYAADNQIELSAALNAVVEAAASRCVLQLEVPPPFPDNTEVKVGGVDLPKITDCAAENGWMYIEPMPYTAIELCGTACEDLKLAGDADVAYYCELL